LSWNRLLFRQRTYCLRHMSLYFFPSLPSPMLGNHPCKAPVLPVCRHCLLPEPTDVPKPLLGNALVTKAPILPVCRHCLLPDMQNSISPGFEFSGLQIGKSAELIIRIFSSFPSPLLGNILNRSFPAISISRQGVSLHR